MPRLKTDRAFYLMLMWLCVIYVCGYSSMSHAQGPSHTQVLVIHTDFVSIDKFKQLQHVAQQHQVDINHISLSKDSNIADAAQKAQIVIFDVPRPSDRAQVIEKALPQVQALQRPLLSIGGGALHTEHIDPVQAQRLAALYQQGGAENFAEFFQALHRWQQTGDLVVAEAQVLPEMAIYHPKSQRLFKTAPEYVDWYNRQFPPTTARLVYVVHPSQVSNLTTQRLDTLIELTQNKHVMPMVLLWNEAKASGQVSAYFKDVPITALVNLTHIQNGQAWIEELKHLNVPMIQALNFHGNQTQWQQSSSGVPPHLASIFLSLPETWGLSDPSVLSLEIDGTSQWLPEQVDSLLARIQAQAKLQHRAPHEKRLAVMFWNYPAGQNNLSASNLNIPKSIENIQQALHQAGYDTLPHQEQKILHDAKQLLIFAQKTPNLQPLAAQNFLGYLSLDAYIKWLKSLPQVRQQELAEHFNVESLKQHWAVVQRNGQWYFAIPRVQYGQVMILPQPPRGTNATYYHDQRSIPDPLYLATYVYLQHEVDALIHLGTHGTQEWLPGKDKGLSVEDYSWLTAGALPIFYPYVQDNVAEALQAKRRGRAVTISHQTAPLAPTGLYDELRDLHDLMHQYIQLDEGMVKQQLQARIIEQTSASGMAQDLGWSTAQMQGEFTQFYERLHEHLHQLAAQAIPMGLHRFGQAPEAKQRIMVVLQQLGADFIHALGQDPREIFNQSSVDIQQSLPFRFLEQHLFSMHPYDADVAAIEVTPALANWLIKAKANEQRLGATHELPSLLNALNGGFIRPTLGGDAIRQPDVESGGNLYAFDANKIPTQAAYQIGQQTFEQLLMQYQQQHAGQTPKKIALSLWSSEAIRHMGVSEGQILAALGLAPVWDQAGRLIDLQIIPREKLQRPRVDVVIQATSVYRDQFSGFMQRLAQAIAKLATLQEADNPIYQHSQSMKAALIHQGYDATEAQHLAALRIFSNAPGEYGSGLSQQILQNHQAQNEQPLATGFLNRLQYAYGEQTWGSAHRVNLLAEQLKGVAVAIMSRSSNVHGVLSTDHAFEYLGGLSLAVRHVQGNSPELFITDLRQNKAQINTLKAYLADEMRSRYLNPTWIQAMQKEGYAGTLEVLKVTNHLYGWNVADPNVVREDQWQDLYETYVKDKRQLGVNEWFERHHPDAQLQMLTRMAKAIEENYWQADMHVQQEITKRIQTLSKALNGRKNSEQLATFLKPHAVNPNTLETSSTAAQEQRAGETQRAAQPISTQATGIGLQASVRPTLAARMPIPPSQAKQAQNSPTMVQGQMLQAVKPQSAPDAWIKTILTCLLTIFAAGMAYQLYQQRQS